MIREETSYQAIITNQEIWWRNKFFMEFNVLAKGRENFPWHSFRVSDVSFIESQFVVDY